MIGLLNIRKMVNDLNVAVQFDRSEAETNVDRNVLIIVKRLYKLGLLRGYEKKGKKVEVMFNNELPFMLEYMKKKSKKNNYSNQELRNMMLWECEMLVFTSTKGICMGDELRASGIGGELILRVKRWSRI